MRSIAHLVYGSKMRTGLYGATGWVLLPTKANYYITEELINTTLSTRTNCISIWTSFTNMIALSLT